MEAKTAIAIPVQEQHDEARAEAEGMVTGSAQAGQAVPEACSPPHGTPAPPDLNPPVTPPKRQLTKTEKDLAELDNIYVYHAPHGSQVFRYQHLRAMAKLLAGAVLNLCPPSRERALALTNIQQATMWANAAIAINEPAIEPEVAAFERLDRIARVCHEANRTYCRTLGDFSQDPWDDAPEWQRASARAGVQTILDNPNTTPRESHEGWMKLKLEEGWVYGPMKDPLLRTHPCLLDYDSLPDAQRVKDVIFGAVARAAAGQ